MVFYELTMQGSFFFLTTWHVDRRTHRSSSVGTVVWYVFEHKQMHSSYGNRIEQNEKKRLIHVLYYNFDRVEITQQL